MPWASRSAPSVGVLDDYATTSMVKFCDLLSAPTFNSPSLEPSFSPLISLASPAPFPGIHRYIVTPMPAILNLKFKVNCFVLITGCGYLTPLSGQQTFRSIQQLDRRRLPNEDLEGSHATRFRSPSFSITDRHSRF